MIWEIFVETVPWAGMSALEIFTAVIMKRERLHTDRIPWSVVRRLIINLFTNQPVHRLSSDKVKWSFDFTAFYYYFYTLRSRKSFKELHYSVSIS